MPSASAPEALSTAPRAILKILAGMAGGSGAAQRPRRTQAGDGWATTGGRAAASRVCLWHRLLEPPALGAHSSPHPRAWRSPLALRLPFDALLERRLRIAHGFFGEHFLVSGASSAAHVARRPSTSRSASLEPTTSFDRRSWLPVAAFVSSETSASAAASWAAALEPASAFCKKTFALPCASVTSLYSAAPHRVVGMAGQPLHDCSPCDGRHSG